MRRSRSFQRVLPRSPTRALLFVLLLATPALALDPAKATPEYIHEVWQTDQGLPRIAVTAICQTRDGYLWLGTDDGLIRFDGVRFTPVVSRDAAALEHCFIQALYVDHEGNLWIGTEQKGLVRYRDGTFTTFTTKDGLANDTVTSIYEDREGSLWAGSDSGEGGLSRLLGGNFTTFTTKDGLPQYMLTDGLQHNLINSIYEDRRGNLWVGSRGGLSRFDDGRFTTFTTKGWPSATTVSSIYEDRQGNLWIGEGRQGLARFSGGKLTTFTTKDGLASGGIRSICEDKDGNLWVGHWGGGLSRLKDRRVTSFTTKDGLSDDQVFSIYEDREGSLWVTTFGGGLNRFRDSRFTTFTTKEGLVNNGTFSVYEDREGRVWIGGYGGLNRYRNGAFTTFAMKDGLAESTVLSIGEDREGSLWIGTILGVSRLKDGRFTTFMVKDGLADNVVTAIHEDQQGNLWIGTFAGGLSRLRDGAFTTFTTKGGLAPGIVNSICEDRRGNLWIGTEGGLSCFSDGGFTTFTTKDGLADNHVNWVHEDQDGSLWIATNGGLNRLMDGAFTTITTQDGLLDDSISWIDEDGRGNLWMAGSKGVSQARGSDLDAFAEGRLRSISSVVYDTADGMKSRECTGGVKARDGRLWITTTKGVAVIDPAHVQANTLPPPVVMEDVLVEGKLLDRPAAGPPLVLAAGTQRLELHYTATSLLVPKRVRFKVRLEGFDSDWVDAGTERTAHYTNLPPKRYTFRVIACNDDGVWNETGASFPFSVAPRFYQTWWWYLLCGLAVAGTGPAVYVVRVNRLKARERRLVELVEEKTSDLRSANVKLLEAQERISRLVESSPGSFEGIPEWSRVVAADVSAAIGADAIGIFEVDRDNVTAVSDSGLQAPSRAELETALAAQSTGLDFACQGSDDAARNEHATPSPGFAGSGDRTVVPVTGMSGELCGALVISGRDVVWGDTERRLVAGFAHQLGAALDMARMRRQLEIAEERRVVTRREMHDRGIATLQICPRCGRCYDHAAVTCPEDGASLESPRPLPYLLLGRYRFLQVLGQGGMGVVFSAHDEKLGRDVAVKLIRPEHWANAKVKQRFEREARAVARIQHPGVVELHDSGALDDGTAFLVMEKLAGCDLRLLLKTHGRGKPAQVAQLLRQGCSALRAAHHAGVVHRDLKPENVFLVDDPSGFRVKILDFGIAKSMAFDKGLTQTGLIVGTPAYMAPEQVQGEEVDSRADVYSFAAVGFEALTGKKAVTGSDLGGILIQVLNQVPPPVSTLVPGIPPEVDAAFESGLAKAAAQRLKDIELWCSSFVELLEKVPGDAATPGWPVSRNVFTRLRESQLQTSSDAAWAPNPDHLGSWRLD